MSLKEAWIGIGDHLSQGSPTLVRNRATQQEVSGSRASEASSAAPHCSPLLTLPPEPSPPPHRGKTVFHETGPWCQKGWGPLIYMTATNTPFLTAKNL